MSHNKLFSGFSITETLSKFLNKDYSGTISQSLLDEIENKTNVKEMSIAEEIKIPYEVNTKKLFEVTYGRVEKNITRLKSSKKKFKVQVQYNYKQYKEYLGYVKVKDSTNIPIVYRSTTLRDAISVKNKIKKGLPGRITVHPNGVRKIENIVKNNIKRKDSTVSKDLPIGVVFNNIGFTTSFLAYYKTPEGEYAKKSFGVRGNFNINDSKLNRAKELAIAVRNEYEWHLVNSVPYYIDNAKFKGWQKMSELQFRQLIDIHMKKIV